MLIKKAIRIIQKEGVKIFFKKFQFYINPKLIFPLLPYTLIKIKTLKRKPLDLEGLVNFSFYEMGGLLIKPMQIKEEISELLKILDKIKPKITLEIGTANGGTLFLFSQVATNDATILSIDLPGGKFGGGYSKWKIPLYKSFARKNQKIHLIRADSHNQKTLEKLKAILNGRKIDFLFIDGDHTYRGVKKDFEMYSPLVKESGIIAFHDIVGHPPETGCEVSRFWEEIKEKYEHQEIVKDWAQSWAGIGIIHKSK